MIVLSSRIFSLSSAYIYPPGVHCGRPRLRSRVSLSVCLFVIYGSSVDFRTSVYSASMRGSGSEYHEALLFY